MTIIVGNESSNRVYSKSDLLWDEKVVDSFEIGSSIRSMKRKNPLSKIGFYSAEFQDLTPADCVFLQLCRTRCDLLIIGLPSDYSLRLNNKEIKFSTDERAFRLGSTVFTNYICIYTEESPSLCIDKINPDLIFYGRTMNDSEFYRTLHKDKLHLIEYPWRKERTEGKFFSL